MESHPRFFDRSPVTRFAEEEYDTFPQTFAEVIKKNELKIEHLKHTVPYDNLPEKLRKYNLKPLVLGHPNVDYGTDCRFCGTTHKC
jgi:hypothetical protein